MKRIIYLPLEPLQERYTVQLSAAKKGWLESRWCANNIPYLRIESEKLTDEIKHGSVLDANGRGYWALGQVRKVLQLLDAGEITDNDVLYFDDFWHPGISALPYSFDLMGIHPKMYAMVHAQSVDPFDFTYPMRHWMRFFEQGIGKILSGIFVTSTCLRDSLIYAGIGTPETIHLAGLPYNSDEVKTHFPSILPKKEKQVVFSSRWDKEKCPEVFLRVVDEIMYKRKDIKFVVTTSAKKLRSNNPELLTLLQTYLDRYPENLFLLENQSKEAYYKTLLESLIQINTADQDFVSWTMLEATTCNCIPLYPNFLSFPEALEFDNNFLYLKGNAADAAKRICNFIEPLVIPPNDSFTWVYSKYDKSWERMVCIMNNVPYEALYSY